MKSHYTIFSLCLCAHVALGGIIVSEPGSGFAPEDNYVWGATARNMDSSSDTWELGLGNNADMTEGGDSQSSFDWSGAGTGHSFALDYDSATALATWTMDGQTNYLLNPTDLFTDFFIQLKTYDSGDFISVSNTTLTVESEVIDIDAFAASGVRDLNTNPDSLQFIHINNFDEPLSDLDFILEGTLFIDWSGTAPTNDEMGMHVKFTQIPEPASIAMVILVSLTGLFVRRRFK